MTRGRRRADPHPSRWRRLLRLEPALVRGAVGSVVTVGLVWGVDLSELGERVATTADVVLGTLAPLLAAWWIRSAVTPRARVEQEVTADGAVVTGPASPLGAGVVVHPAPVDEATPDGSDAA